MNKLLYLKNIWDQISSDEDFFNNVIIPKYSETHRFYHSTNHIFDMLTSIQIFIKKERVSQFNINCLYFATFFHDIVYDTSSHKNEENSNQLWISFAQSNKIDPDTESIVSQMILATINHQNPENIHAISIFLDIDLCILGSDAIKFKNYEDNIRKEYHFVDEFTYQQKRYSIMNSLATKKFNTRIAHINWGLSRTRNLAKYKNLLDFFNYYENKKTNGVDESDILFKELIIQEYTFQQFFKKNSHIEYLFFQYDKCYSNNIIISHRDSLKKISEKLQIDKNDNIFIQSILQTKRTKFTPYLTFFINYNHPQNKSKNKPLSLLKRDSNFFLLIEDQLQIFNQFKKENHELNQILYDKKIKISDIDPQINILKKIEHEIFSHDIFKDFSCDNRLICHYPNQNLEKTFQLIDFFFKK